MNVRSAVEARDNAIQAAADETPLPALVAQAVERQADVLQAVLPEHMDRARFEQITLAAIKGTPKLVRCFETLEGRTSVLFGVIQAASAGLEINSIAKEAWLIPREVSYKHGNDWRKRMEATLQLDYRGVKKLARRDPAVSQIFAEVVRDGDHFIHRRGLDADVLEHEPVGDSNRELTHAYAVVRYHDSPATYMVLDRAAVEKRRAMSTGYRFDLAKTPEKRTNPWFTWEAEQWRKTAIHAIKGELDLAPDIARVLAGDDRPLRLNEGTGDIEPTAEIEDIETPALEAVPDPTPDDTEPDQAPQGLQVTDLITAAVEHGHIAKNSGHGTRRKKLMALATDLIGVTVTDPDELVADQSVAEELLARLAETKDAG
ncbi:MAG: recombinase RecT [Deltaproteobacteria bacterium]|nr:recombinase RecT [Deltaproteobacteria bacterium]